MKAFLLLNGQSPSELPDLQQYVKVYCTDGAYAFLEQNRIQPDYVIGDFDSVDKNNIPVEIETIKTINQDFTDFHKCLQIIHKQKYTAIDVYGATGKENDHFLGNLTTAHHFKESLEITFIDDYSTFFFTKKEVILNEVNKKIISLYPFPKATNVQSEGLYYPLNGMDLNITQQIGTRNHAIQNQVKITYDDGDLIVFVSNDRLSQEALDYKEEINAKK